MGSITPPPLHHYLTHAGLAIAHPALDDDFVQRTDACLHAKPNMHVYWETLFTYPVPKLSPDGSCSVHETLEEKPYDLRDTILRTCKERDEKINAAGLALFRLNLLVELLHRETQSDWTGVYVSSPTNEGAALIKLAYRGRPSRAEFPLTQAFASHSNNSTVGITGKAVLVESVQTHLEAGKPYYECDAAVQSELCIPIFSPGHSEPRQESPAYADDVIGIIDLESFTEHHFTGDRILNAATACFSASILLQRLKSII